MSYYEKISCRIAIQVCVGHFPDGRERHRTFSMKGVGPDASLEAIAAIIRALAPVLAYPITKVRKVVKREIFFYEEAVMPVPQDNDERAEEAPKIIMFHALEPGVVHDAAVCAGIKSADPGNSDILPFPSLIAEPLPGQVGSFSERAPPGDDVLVQDICR